MKKLAYLIVREELDSPLVQSQCIDVISSINHNWVDGRVELVWFYRVDYLFRKNSTNQSELRKRLCKAGIKAHFLPFISAGFPLQWWALPFVLPQWIVGLIYLRFCLGFRFYHCRSYHAGLLGRFGSSVAGSKYIFDPRSPFPEENVSAERWGGNSLSKKIWKRLETWIINGAAATVVVSRGLVDLYEKIKPASQFKLVPNNYPASFESYMEDKITDGEKEYTLCYLGSFGNWNTPEPYIRLLAGLNALVDERVNMLFIVRTEAEYELIRQAKRFGVDRSLFDVLSVSQREVPLYLAKCRFGVYLMDIKDPRLGVKTVEYLAAGLPVIVSENIVGAAEIVRANGLGVSWDHSDMGCLSVAAWISNVHDDMERCANICRGYAKEHLSCQSVGLQLIKLYEEAFG